MPNGAQYINTLLGPFPTKEATSAMALTAADAGNLSSILQADARDHFYSACISFVDAIRGLDAGFYTWPTVKCYYSVFYSLRSLLALSGICIVYVPRRNNKISEYWIQSTPGAGLRNEKESGSHKLTLRIFGRQNPEHRLLSNPIDGKRPTSWLIEKREECSYRRTRFQEPVAPDHFNQVLTYGVRRLLGAYITDTIDSYTFQKDHAMLAYPLATLVHTGKRLQTIAGVGIEDDELAFLTEECCDKVGAITPLTAFFRDLSK